MARTLVEVHVIMHSFSAASWYISAFVLTRMCTFIRDNIRMTTLDDGEGEY